MGFRGGVTFEISKITEIGVIVSLLTVAYSYRHIRLPCIGCILVRGLSFYRNNIQMSVIPLVCVWRVLRSNTFYPLRRE